MKKIALLFLVAFFSVSIHAQCVDCGNAISGSDAQMALGRIANPTPTTNQLLKTDFIRSIDSGLKSGMNSNGNSPYVNNTFERAILSTHKNKSFDARYNGVTGDIELLDPIKEKVFILNRNIGNYNIELTKSNKTYKLINFTDKNNDLDKGFFIEICHNEKICLLKKEEIKYVAAVPASSHYDKAKPARYKRLKDKFYIAFSGKPAKEFPKSKSKLAMLFPDHSKLISNYIKKNKIKLSKEKDLIKTVTYINSLL